MVKKTGMAAGLIILLLALVAVAGAGMARQSAMQGAQPSGPSGNTGSQAADVAQNAPAETTAANGIVTGYSIKNDVSLPLRDIPARPVTDAPNVLQVPREFPSIVTGSHKDAPDQVVQSSFGALGSAAMPGAGTSFQGIGNSADGLGGCACIPPDTNADVGSTQIVETVNSAFAVYNKTGGTLLSPRNINTIWAGFGGACETRNDGDPVVAWDPMASRWLVSQFTSAKPYNECIAISKTADATGAWNRYAFQLSTSDFPDYPHFGVWPDGYYMSVNWFIRAQRYGGPRPYVFDRAKMLAGLPATFQTTSAALGSGQSPIHPTDLDGTAQPPAGAPNAFFGFGSPMKVFKFHVDWANPANTTWTNTQSLATAGFTQQSAGIPQQGTTQTLDALGDRLMNRVAYRNFGTHESWVLNHAADAGTPAGVRWYELRGPSTGTLNIYQQSTYAGDNPGDTTSRWMAGIAQDKQGNIAIGYSASSSSVYPGIRYAGRLAGDPINKMAQGEAVLLTGTGYQ
ncbi:MAG TPA: hypothetical protein VM536_08480, partial [Chloroflexia bacterium]|nr:hypothetical protein [Chloroflexia bacterium]